MMKQFKGELVREFSRASASSRGMDIFLRSILTPKEYEVLATRLQIVKLLKQGLTQRQVADRLGVGIGTVTRGSRELYRGSFTHVS